jgi:hypothetical protein
MVAGALPPSAPAPAPVVRAAEAVECPVQRSDADPGPCAALAAAAANGEPAAVLALAECEADGNRLVEGLQHAQRALEGGIVRRDADTMKRARMRVKEYIERIPHVTFVPSCDGVVVSFDGRAVPADALTKKFSVDPGVHRVRLEGTHASGRPLTLEREVCVVPSQMHAIPLADACAR